jgi:two-component system phosphate regulon response regulator PhoB
MREPPTILVVDDEDPIVMLITDALMDESYVVRSVSHGLDALRTLAEQPPALMLLDYMMPGLNGLEVLAQVQRAGAPALPIIMMSATSIGDICLQHGATAFLAKPFTIEELLTVVKRYLPVQTGAVVADTPAHQEATGSSTREYTRSVAQAYTA